MFPTGWMTELCPFRTAFLTPPFPFFKTSRRLAHHLGLFKRTDYSVYKKLAYHKYFIWKYFGFIRFLGLIDDLFPFPYGFNQTSFHLGSLIYTTCFPPLLSAFLRRLEVGGTERSNPAPAKAMPLSETSTSYLKGYW